VIWLFLLAALTYALAPFALALLAAILLLAAYATVTGTVHACRNLAALLRPRNRP
jgi:hypothetical protein